MPMFCMPHSVAKLGSRFLLAPSDPRFLSRTQSKPSSFQKPEYDRPSPSSSFWALEEEEEQQVPHVFVSPFKKSQASFRREPILYGFEEEEEEGRPCQEEEEEEEEEDCNNTSLLSEDGWDLEEIYKEDRRAITSKQSGYHYC